MAATNFQQTIAFQVPTDSTGQKAGGVYRGNGTPSGLSNAAPKASLYVNATATNGANRLFIATDDVGGWAVINAAS